MPGGEHRTVGGEHDAERIARADLRQRSGQLLHHIERERIALLRTVQHDGHDMAGLEVLVHGRSRLDDQVLVFHVPPQGLEP